MFKWVFNVNLDQLESILRLNETVVRGIIYSLNQFSEPHLGGRRFIFDTYCTLCIQ